MNKVITASAAVLVVCLGAAHQQQKPVDGQTRVWSPRDCIELTSVFEGKASETFFVPQTHAQQVNKLRQAGYKVHFAKDEFHGTISWTPFLCKERLNKPTLWDLQRPDSMYVQGFWSQKAQKWAVWFNRGD